MSGTRASRALEVFNAASDQSVDFTEVLLGESEVSDGVVEERNAVN